MSSPLPYHSRMLLAGIHRTVLYASNSCRNSFNGVAARIDAGGGCSRLVPTELPASTIQLRYRFRQRQTSFQFQLFGVGDPSYALSPNIPLYTPFPKPYNTSMYLEFYGLKENPFNVTSDPNFLYLSHTHKEALNHLLYGIEQRKGFVEITGEIGAGKTTLCRALLNQLDDKTKTSFIFNSNLPENQLLEAILDDFGIVPERRNKVTFIRQLNDFLLKGLSEGDNAVLIIDEAQNLRASTLESIRMLSNLETEKEKLLQIILVGQPQLREKLNSPKLEQLRQRINIRFHVEALNKNEIQGYIDHRLYVAGPVRNIIFAPEALEHIYSYSRGIPRVINIICDKSLLLGFVQGEHFIGRDTIQRSIEELEGQFMSTPGVR